MDIKHNLPFLMQNGITSDGRDEDNFYEEALQGVKYIFSDLDGKPVDLKWLRIGEIFGDMYMIVYSKKKEGKLFKKGNKEVAFSVFELINMMYKQNKNYTNLMGETYTFTEKCKNKWPPFIPAEDLGAAWFDFDEFDPQEEFYVEWLEEKSNLAQKIRIAKYVNNDENVNKKKSKI